MTKPLEIAAFWDARSGHRKQTRGILDALGRLTPVEIHDIWLPEPGLATAASDWGRFALSLVKPVRLPEVDARGNPLPKGADLVLGTGSRAHAAMILFARIHGSRVVTCMTPDLIFRSRMDLCLVPEHDRVKPADNMFTTLGPPNPAPHDGAHEPGKGLILVGGIDKKTHVWDPDSTLARVRAIVKQRPGVHWVISSSPRTPKDTCQLIDKLERENENVTFFRAENTVTGWIEERYSESETAWVTADSVSMIYEALTAGCRVGVLPVDWKDPDSKLARAVAALCEKGMVTGFDQWQKDTGQKLECARLDEAGRCAREILKRFWPHRLDKGET